jgi:ectoine hydroxylase-related dioxygenase (phytanoyl-CoA dioxygenase family)
LLSQLQENGFAVVENLVSAEELAELVNADIRISAAGLRQPHLNCRAVAELVESAAVQEVVRSVLGCARLVRSILFDKTTESNWGVPWHQDLTVAVGERREIPRFVGWSVKDGIYHAQAPREVLDQMLTIRIHLDDCGRENGPLRVLPGTHKHGWLDADGINRAKAEVLEHVCVVGCAGAVVMRPLLLHASSRATRPGHRRVLHLEFATAEVVQLLAG